MSSGGAAEKTESLGRTPLHALHVELGARMVPFAGYDMPIQYPAGILKEHQHCRAAAALFDVAHMGVVELRGPDATAALEAIVPGDLQALAEGNLRYSFFTNEAAGILDDLMITRDGPDAFTLVVNAACKQQDIAHLQAHLPDAISVTYRDDLALLAIQGPQASAALARLDPGCADMAFMSARTLNLNGIDCRVTRSGYTGEDGFEIAAPLDRAEQMARRLLAEPEVEPAGLGARDSLRLEAGLCLYGHDLDQTTTPVEAGLLWAISKRRRAEGGFPGADVVQRQITDGPARKRVGLLMEGRGIAREGSELTMADGTFVGALTSGGFGPSVGRGVAMGYVGIEHAAVDTALQAVVRGKPQPCSVAKMPFIPQRYYRG